MAKDKEKTKNPAEPTGIITCRWCGEITSNWASVACDDCATLYQHITRKYFAALKMVGALKR